MSVLALLLLLAEPLPQPLSAPVWCQGGQRLAWVTQLGGERLWVFSDPDHLDQPPLPFRPVPACQPELSWWNPLGDRLAYIADTRDGRALLTVAPDSTEGRPFALVGRLHPPVLAWSPDGSHLAFSRVADEGSGTPYEIFAVATDGEAPVKVGVATLPQAIVWAPTNDAFAFVARARRNHNLFVVVPARRAAFRLSDYLEVLPHSLAWATDGRRLLFAGSGDLSQGARLFIIRREGRENADQVQVPGYHSDAAPVWSDDGQWVAWIAGPLSRPGRGNLLLGPGDNVHQATAALRGGGVCTQPCFSPGSRWLAFTQWSSQSSTHSQVAVMALAESRVCHVLSAEGDADAPVFSPDGKRLAYRCGAPGRRRVAVVDLAGL